MCLRLWSNPVSEYHKFMDDYMKREKTENIRRSVSHYSYDVEVERVERFGNVKYYADIRMKDGVTTIKAEFFKGWDDPRHRNCFLRSIDTNDVKFIGEKAFFGCGELTTVRLREAVTEIGFGAFLGCSQLVNVVAPAQFLTSEYFPVATRFTRRRSNKCQYCGGEFTGIFEKKCSKCGQAKDY